MNRQPRGSRARRRGYTLVELMMAIAVFTTAVLGIITLQKMTVVSNKHAKDVTTAQRIAQAWAAQLELDGTVWRTGNGAGFLNQNATWDRPSYIPARKFGAAFDALGNPLTDSDADVARASFCTHVRMNWLYPGNTGRAGNAVIRAEIRVFWLRDGKELPAGQLLCRPLETQPTITNIGFANELYHFIYQPVAIRQHFQI